MIADLHNLHVIDWYTHLRALREQELRAAYRRRRAARYRA